MEIALIGYGKMGKAIENNLVKTNHVINCRLGKKDPLELLLENKPDIAIEFTQPETAFKNTSYCIKNNIPVISGTTGWSKQLIDITKLCHQYNGTFLHASNFSIGVNLFFELNKWLANKLSIPQFIPSINETHHTEKKDSPSGTAITLAEDILSISNELDGWQNKKSTNPKKIEIISNRIPKVPGTHTVNYTSPLESIEITHVTHNRCIFATSIIKVAEWIYKKKGIFTMSDFITDN